MENGIKAARDQGKSARKPSSSGVKISLDQPFKPKTKVAKLEILHRVRFFIQALTFSGFIAQGLLYYKFNFRPLGNLLPFMAYDSIGNQVVSSALVLWGIIFLLTLVFGRFVCGWLCPIGFIQDVGEKLLKFFKIKLPPPVRQTRIPRYILAGIVLLHFIVMPVLASPLRLWKYDLNFHQPWLLGFPFHISLFALDLAAIFVVIGIILPLYFGSRPYCKLVCETGLLLDRVSQFSVGRIRRNQGFDRDTCITCSKCSNHCPQAINVYEEVNLFDRVVNPECISCLECVTLCPNDTIIYSLRAQMQDTGKVQGYLAQLRARVEDMPRFALTGLGTVMGGYIGFVTLPPSYFHTYLLFASIGSLSGWMVWRLVQKIAGEKKIEEVLRDGTQTQAERDAAAGLAPLSNKDKMKMAANDTSHRWIFAGVACSVLIISLLLFVILSHVPSRIIMLGEIDSSLKKPEERAQSQVLYLGIPPSLSLDRLQVAYGPFRDYLSDKLHIKIQLITAASYGELAQGLESGFLDIAILPPQASLSLRYRRVETVRQLLQTLDHGQNHYSSILVGRIDGPQTLDELKGHRIAFTSLDSISGYAVPLVYLRSKNISVLDFSDMTLAGNHNHALELLAAKRVDVAATYQGALDDYLLRYPQAGIRTLAVAGEVPTDVLAIRADLALKTADALQAALLGLRMRNTQTVPVLEGLAQTGISGFVPFDVGSYLSLGKMLAQ